MGNIFSSTDIRGHVGETFTTEYVWNVGKALAEWLPEEGVIVIVKAESANASTVHALVEGLLLQGRTVIDGGNGDKQSVMAAISDQQAAGGAYVDYNQVQNLAVITLFDAQGVIVTDASGLTEIGQLVDAANFVPAPDKGELKSL